MTHPFFRHTRTGLALAGVLLASGCTFGGKYQRPELDTPADWRWDKAQPAPKQTADATPASAALSAPVVEAAPITTTSSDVKVVAVAAPVVDATAAAALPTPSDAPVLVSDQVTQALAEVQSAPGTLAAVVTPAVAPEPVAVAVAAPAQSAPVEKIENAAVSASTTAPANAPAPVAVEVTPGTVAVPDPEWWKVFNDAKLNELEATALSANQDIRLAVARVDEARATARVKKADFFPQLSTNPTFARSQNSAHNFFIGGGNVQEDALRKIHNNFSLPVDFSYEIDVWGRIKHEYAASRKRAEATVADFGAVQLTVTSDVAVNYFLLKALDTQWEVLQKTMKLREESLKIVDTKFKFGSTDKQDLVRSKADLASTAADIADIKRQREEVSNVIAILCGKPASNFSMETKPLTALPPVIPAGLPSALLERRPDVIKAERNLAAAHEDVRVAHTAFFPRISLTARGGLESAELSNFVSLPSTAWNFGANLLQPLFSGGRNKANLEAAKARYEQAQAQYRQQVLISFKDTEDALLDIQFRAEQAKALEESANAAREVSALALTKYQGGTTSYLDVVDAQRQQLAVELQSAQVLGQRLVASVRLVKALGGGWSMQPDQKENGR